ncbi:MAG TPA: M50 family metallopeptidase [Planctomycetota bacterium]|nr:M50 family metallopeptidase [Planctomycetota bacterium]
MNISIEPRRTAWDLNFNLLRLPVRIHPLFWLMSLMLAYSSMVPFTSVMIVVAVVTVSILVHEYGHALSHIRFGDRHPRVVLHVMGGLCIGSGEVELVRRQKIIMLLWGPGAGFIFGLIAYIVGAIVFGPRFPFESFAVSGWRYYSLVALDALVWVNLVWGLMNLLPVFPLDGGQILREWIGWKKPELGTRAPFTISFYTAIAAAVAGIGLGAYWYSSSKDGRDFFLFFLFAALAFSNWHLRKQIDQFGGFEGGHDFASRREPWEQDADWWKR